LIILLITSTIVKGKGLAFILLPVPKHISFTVEAHEFDESMILLIFTDPEKQLKEQSGFLN